jgi:hypothetical protein
LTDSSTLLRLLTDHVAYRENYDFRVTVHAPWSRPPIGWAKTLHDMQDVFDSAGIRVDVGSLKELGPAPQWLMIDDRRENAHIVATEVAGTLSRRNPSRARRAFRGKARRRALAGIAGSCWLGTRTGRLPEAVSKFPFTTGPTYSRRASEVSISKPLPIV